MQYNTILYLFQSWTRLLTSIFILTQRKGRQHGGFPCVCLNLTPASKAGGFSYEPTHSFSSTAPEELGFHSMQENVEKIPMLVSEQELIDMLFSLAATNALSEALSSRIKRLFRAKQEYLSFHLLFQEHDLRNYCVNPQKLFKIFLQSYRSRRFQPISFRSDLSPSPGRTRFRCSSRRAFDSSGSRL